MSVVIAGVVVCEVVLAFVFREPAEVDGMARTVVIARHAGEAAASVEPFGAREGCGLAVGHAHVADRAMLDASAASGASRGINLEPFVVDEPGMEERAEATAVEAWRGSAVDGHTHGTAVDEDVGEAHEGCAGFHLFLCLAQVGVNIHEREADV